MQRTLVLKKQVQLDELDKKFAQKRQEFKIRMEALEHKRAAVEWKQQQVSQTVACVLSVFFCSAVVHSGFYHLCFRW